MTTTYAAYYAEQVEQDRRQRAHRALVRRLHASYRKGWKR